MAEDAGDSREGVDVRAARPCALLAWSGGKDAAWSLHSLRATGAVEVVGLVATITRDDEVERATMQGVRVDVLRAQADAAGLPLLEMRIPRRCDNVAYEAAFAATLAAARDRWPGLEAIAFGDLLLDDIRAWREALCDPLGWRAMFPLYGSNTADLAPTMVAGGLRAAISCVDTEQLDAAFAGRAFDADLLAALPAGVDPCGEHGEFHTCVTDGPMFGRPLVLERGDTVMREGRFAYTEFRLA